MQMALLNIEAVDFEGDFSVQAMANDPVPTSMSPPSQVGDDNDDEAEGAGEASGQSDSKSGEGSGADEMSGDGDEMEEEGADEEEDEKTEDVIVPVFQNDRKTRPLFEESLREYMRRTRQEMNPYQRKFICTHGWPERERSTGARKVHKLRRSACPFQFLAQVVDTKEGWDITLKREVYRHNHRISREIYSSYPGIRQVLPTSPQMPGVELPVESEAGNTSIYDYIWQHSNHRVTMDDVRNLVARVRQYGEFGNNASFGADSFISPQQIKELKATPCFMWTVETRFVPETVRYRLPEDLIDMALEKFKPEKTTLHDGQPNSETIAVDGNDSDDVPVVVTQKIGEISREQLEAMKWIWNPGKMCSEGGKCITWLFSDVKQVVFNHSEVLYRFRSGKWLRDGSIRVFTEYLRRKYSTQCHCVHADGKQHNCTGTESEVADILPRATLVEIRSCVDDTAKDNVFFPVNFDTSHWVYLVDDKANKTWQPYDSLNKRKIAKVLKTLAAEIVSGVFDGEYEVTTLRTPRQKDGDSCGVFVCLRFCGQVSSDVPDDVTPRGCALGDAASGDGDEAQ
ncbi:unnamed protein product [Phytophthora fragariaefolia]|uniref:Unnamed protein product n=1 Tax=Phytophthora fragariaefolia TaxID=1490495 RepID=A0A9W6TVX1_9STRA|nr:unnamed protein product [Phytophthora fragariaefolia]